MKDIAFEEQGPMRPLPRLLLAVAPVASVAILGSLVTTPNIPDWYAILEKPTGTPPNWLFGPVWTVLYGLMAFAFWRVLGLPRDTPRRSLAIATFSAQLVLNLAWSFVFFGLRSPLPAFVVIFLLVAAILACILVLGQIDTASAIALAPYGLWVLYATFLNAGVWWLNGRPALTSRERLIILCLSGQDQLCQIERERGLAPDGWASYRNWSRPRLHLPGASPGRLW